MLSQSQSVRIHPSVHPSSRHSLDDTRSLRGLRAPPNRPCADLIGPAREVADEIEGRVAGGGDLAEGAVRPDALLLLGALLVRGHEREALLERDGEGDERVAGVVLVDPGFDLREPLVLLADVVPLGEIYEVRDRLRGEELKTVDDIDLGRDEGERLRRLGEGIKESDGK